MSHSNRPNPLESTKKSQELTLSDEQLNLIKKIRIFCQSRSGEPNEVIGKGNAFIKELAAQKLAGDTFYHAAIYARCMIEFAKKCDKPSNVTKFETYAQKTSEFFKTGLAIKKADSEEFSGLALTSFNEASVHISNYIMAELLTEQEDSSKHIASYLKIIVKGVKNAQIDEVKEMIPSLNITAHMHTLSSLLLCHNSLQTPISEKKEAPKFWLQDYFRSAYCNEFLFLILHCLDAVHKAAVARLKKNPNAEPAFQPDVIITTRLRTISYLAKIIQFAPPIINQHHLMQIILIVSRLILLTCRNDKWFKNHGLDELNKVLIFMIEIAKNNWQIRSLLLQAEFIRAELDSIHKKPIVIFIESAYIGSEKILQNKDAKTDYTVHLTFLWSGTLQACQQIKSRLDEVARKNQHQAKNNAAHSTKREDKQSQTTANETFELTNSIIVIREACHILDNISSSYQFLIGPENNQKTHQLISMPFPTFKQEINDSLSPFIKDTPLELEKIKNYLRKDENPTSAIYTAIEEELHNLVQAYKTFALLFEYFAKHQEYFLVDNNPLEYFSGLHKKLLIVTTLVENETKAIKNIMQEKIGEYSITCEAMADQLIAQEKTEKEQRKKEEEAQIKYFEQAREKVNEIFSLEQQPAEEEDDDNDVNTNSIYEIRQIDIHAAATKALKQAEESLKKGYYHTALEQFSKLKRMSKNFRLESMNGELACQALLLKTKLQHCTKLLFKIAQNLNKEPVEIGQNLNEESVKIAKSCYAEIIELEKQYEIVSKKHKDFKAKIANSSSDSQLSLPKEMTYIELLAQITIDNLEETRDACLHARDQTKLQFRISRIKCKLSLGLEHLKIINPNTIKNIITVGLQYHLYGKNKTSSMDEKTFATLLPKAKECYQAGSAEYIKKGKNKKKAEKSLSHYTEHREELKKFKLESEKSKKATKVPAPPILIYPEQLTGDELLTLLSGNRIWQVEEQEALKKQIKKNTNRKFSAATAYEFICSLICPDIAAQFDLLYGLGIFDELIGCADEEKINRVKKLPEINEYLAKIANQIKTNPSPKYEIALAHLLTTLLFHWYPLPRLIENLIERTRADLPISQVCQIFGLGSQCKNILFALLTGKIALTLSSTSTEDSTVALVRNIALQKMRAIFDIANINEYPPQLYANDNNLLQQIITMGKSPEHISLFTNLDLSQFGFAYSPTNDAYHRKLSDETIDSAVSIFVNPNSIFKSQGDLTINHLAYDHLLRQLIYFNENTSVDLSKKKIRFVTPFNPMNAEQLLTYMTFKKEYGMHDFELLDTDQAAFDIFLKTLTSQQSTFLPSIFTLAHQYMAQDFIPSRFPNASAALTRRLQNANEKNISTHMQNMFTMGDAVGSFIAAVNEKLIGILFLLSREALPLQDDTIENIIKELYALDQTVKFNPSNDFKNQRFATITAILIHHSLLQIGMDIDVALSGIYKDKLNPEVIVALKARIAKNTLAADAITTTTDTATQTQPIPLNRLTRQQTEVIPRLNETSLFSRSEKKAALFQTGKRKRASSTSSYFDSYNYDKQNDGPDKNEKEYKTPKI